VISFTDRPLYPGEEPPSRYPLQSKRNSKLKQLCSKKGLCSTNFLLCLTFLNESLVKCNQFSCSSHQQQNMYRWRFFFFFFLLFNEQQKYMSLLFPAAPILHKDNVIKVTLYFLNETSQTKAPRSQCSPIYTEHLSKVSGSIRACEYKIHMSSSGLMAGVLEAIKHDRIGWRTLR
jgi:hypothetical protein